MADSSSAQAPPPQPAENAADNYMAAAASFVEVEGAEEEACTVMEKGWVGKHPLIQDALFQNTDAFGELRDGLKKPYCSMPAVEGFDTQLPYLGTFRHMARLMLAEGRLYESQGEYEKACQDFAGVVKLGHDIPRNGVLIHCLVGIALENIAFGVFRSSLKSHGASAGVYVKAARRLEELAATELPLADVFRQELAVCDKEICRIVLKLYGRVAQQVRPELLCFPPLLIVWYSVEGVSSYTAGLDEMQVFPSGWPVIWLLFPPNVGTFMANLKSFGDAAVKRAEMPYPEAAKTRLVIPDDPMCKLLVPAYEHVQVLYTAAGVRAALTRTMAALVAYQKIHGRYPPSLEAIVSAAGPPRADAPLSHIPMDLFDGKPLRYKTIGEGFVLYSVGPDMVDDHAGRECPASLDTGTKGDIVFRLER